MTDSQQFLPPRADANDAVIVGQRILVVGDNVDAAETMLRLLVAAGHTVRAAYGGRDALDLAAVFRPDVVFLDIGLPGSSGHDVARRLRANSATPSFTFCAPTGWGAPADLVKSRAEGFHVHLTKPIDMGAVTSLLAARGQSM